MATTLEIVTAISQIVGNSYDGALDENGEPIKIGLRREVENPIIDSRVMDGFKVSFHGDTLRIHYHSEINLREVHSKRFTDDVNQTVADIASFIKKEYRKTTGTNLSLRPLAECDINVQSMSRIRNWIQCTQDFKIGGIKATPAIMGSEDTVVRKEFEKFNKLAGTSQPRNVTRVQPARPGLGEVDQ